MTCTRIIFGRTRRTPEGRALRRKNVIRGILLREASGESLRAGVVKSEDHDLFISGKRLFGSWGAALRTVGIDTQAVFGTRTWTRGKVIREIRGLRRRGVPLNYTYMQRMGHGLIHGAVKFFGSWRNALRAAGYEPAAVGCRLVAYTKSEVIQALHAQADARRPISQASMCPGSIIPATRRLFGSFRNAVRAAGLLYLVKEPIRWSKAETIKAVRERHRGDQPLHCLAVLRNHVRLYNYALKFFGTWRRALVAAGIDPTRVERKRPDWTPQTVISELRRKATEPPAKQISSIRPTSLVAACIRFFGSLEDAAAAAGVDPRLIAPRRGTCARAFFAKRGQLGHKA